MVKIKMDLEKEREIVKMSKTESTDKIKILKSSIDAPMRYLKAEWRGIPEDKFFNIPIDIEPTVEFNNVMEMVSETDIPNLELVKEDHPNLTQVCQEFDWTNPPFDILKFSLGLVKTMRDLNGLGLAANQVGVPYRIFCVRSDPNKVLINPRIIVLGTEQIILEEGCLTFPSLWIKIKRSRHLKVRYEMPNQETITETYTGMTARIIQHELDHLDGILFFNRASRYHKDQAFKRRNKFLKELNNGRVYDGSPEADRIS